jgi:hypothetical protein
MNINQIIDCVLKQCQGSRVYIASQACGDPKMAWGDCFFYANRDDGPESSKQLPFATIITKDYGEFDHASNLNRPGFFRLNIGISAPTFTRLFSDLEPSTRRIIDYAAQDCLFPHPVYAAQHFVCIINPTETTFDEVVAPLMAEACALAARRTR